MVGTMPSSERIELSDELYVPIERCERDSDLSVPTLATNLICLCPVLPVLWDTGRYS